MNARRLVLSIACIALFAAALPAQDLSGYRKFAFGADLPAIAKQAGMRPADAQTICQRPQLIQDLEWQPRSAAVLASPDLKSVKQVLFRFYEGTLSSMAITYDRDSTEGLTVDDMIEAISVNYGTATRPVEEVVFPSIYGETVKVLARWEDSKSSFRLVRSTYPPVFALLGTSKSLEPLTAAALAAAKAIDIKEAPQKEIAHRQQEDEAARLELEKVRQANKLGFRP
jgi:hypothetical protein